MNGEQITTIILNRLDQIEKKIDRMDEKIDTINAYGCAHRSSDLSRIERAEKGISALFWAFLISIAAIALQFFGIHLGGTH